MLTNYRFIIETQSGFEALHRQAEMTDFFLTVGDFIKIPNYPMNEFKILRKIHIVHEDIKILKIIISDFSR